MNNKQVQLPAQTRGTRRSRERVQQHLQQMPPSVGQLNGPSFDPTTELVEFPPLMTSSQQLQQLQQQSGSSSPAGVATPSASARSSFRGLFSASANNKLEPTNAERTVHGYTSSSKDGRSPHSLHSGGSTSTRSFADLLSGGSSSSLVSLPVTNLDVVETEYQLRKSMSHSDSNSVEQEVGRTATAHGGGGETRGDRFGVACDDRGSAVSTHSATTMIDNDHFTDTHDDNKGKVSKLPLTQSQHPSETASVVDSKLTNRRRQEAFGSPLTVPPALSSLTPGSDALLLSTFGYIELRTLAPGRIIAPSDEADAIRRADAGRHATATSIGGTSGNATVKGFFSSLFGSSPDTKCTDPLRTPTLSYHQRQGSDDPPLLPWDPTLNTLDPRERYDNSLPPIVPSTSIPLGVPRGTHYKVPAVVPKSPSVAKSTPLGSSPVSLPDFSSSDDDNSNTHRMSSHERNGPTSSSHGSSPSLATDSPSVHGSLESMRKETDFWMEDADVKRCYQCQASFNAFRRRHHCRLCGQIFCWKCTQSTVADRAGNPLRVCLACYLRAQMHATAAAAAAAPRAQSSHAATVAQQHLGTRFGQLGADDAVSDHASADPLEQATFGLSIEENEPGQVLAPSSEVISASTVIDISGPAGTPMLDGGTGAELLVGGREDNDVGKFLETENYFMSSSDKNPVPFSQNLRVFSEHEMPDDPPLSAGSGRVQASEQSQIIASAPLPRRATSFDQSASSAKGKACAKNTTLEPTPPTLRRSLIGTLINAFKTSSDRLPEASNSSDSMVVSEESDHEDRRRSPTRADSVPTYRSSPKNIRRTKFADPLLRTRSATIIGDEVDGAEGTAVGDRKSPLELQYHPRKLRRQQTMVAFEALRTPANKDRRKRWKKHQEQQRETGSNEIEVVSPSSPTAKTLLGKKPLAISAPLTPVTPPLPDATKGASMTPPVGLTLARQLLHDFQTRKNATAPVVNRPPLVDTASTKAAARGRLDRFVEQILQDEGLSPTTWHAVVSTIARRAAGSIICDVRRGDAIDVRAYLKVKCVPDSIADPPGSVPTVTRPLQVEKNQVVQDDHAWRCDYIEGVCFRRNWAHKKMAPVIDSPRILLLDCAIEFQTDARRLLQLDDVLSQERQHLKLLVARIVSLRPHVVLVGKRIARRASEFLHASGVAFAANVKAQTLHRIARATHAIVLTSPIQLSQQTTVTQSKRPNVLGTCKRVFVRRFTTSRGVGFEDDKNVFLCFDGCDPQFGGTVFLRGAKKLETLKHVKRAILFCTYVAYNLRLEAAMLADEHAALPAALVEFAGSAYGMEKRVLSASLGVTFDSHRGIRHIDHLDNKLEPATLDEIPEYEANQRVVYLHSMLCRTSGVQCVPFELHVIHFYGTSDLGLGQFLLQYCFSDSTKCRAAGCGRPLTEHDRCFVHGDARLNISVNVADPQAQLDVMATARENAGHEPGADLSYLRDSIIMWAYCRECHDVTPMRAMSRDTFCFSFGKFLETGFYASSPLCREPDCSHSAHRDHIRYFFFNGFIAEVEYERVDLANIAVPPLNFPENRIESELSPRDMLDATRSGMQKLYGGLFDRLITLKAPFEFAGSEVETKSQASEDVGNGGAVAEFEYLLQSHGAEVGHFSTELQRLLPAIETEPTKALADIAVLHRQLYLKGLSWLNLLADKQLKAWQLVHSRKKILSGRKRSSHARSASIDSKGIDFFSNSVGTRMHAGTPADTRRVVGRGPDVDEARLQRVCAELGPTSLLNATFELARLACNQINEPSKPSLNVGDIDTANEEGDAHKAPGDVHKAPKAPIPLFLPAGMGNTAVVVYEEDVGSMIAYALLSHDYGTRRDQLRGEVPRDPLSVSLDHPGIAAERDPATDLDAMYKAWFIHTKPTTVDLNFECNMQNSSSLWEKIGPHVEKVDAQSIVTSVSDDVAVRDAYIERFASAAPPVTTTAHISVQALFALQFEALRHSYGVDTSSFTRSLSTSNRWNAKGGKSGSRWEKTEDERFIIKEMSKAEAQSFSQIAPLYFEYLSQAYFADVPTALAKVLGVFVIKYRSTTQSSRLGTGISTQDEWSRCVVVMENLFAGQRGRNVTDIFDLKGSKRSRYVRDPVAGAVLLDENLLEMMYANPLWVHEEAKRQLRTAIWNDTLFLSQLGIMDYSLVVGIDPVRREICVGIIDYLRKYTWDKQLETWVKSSRLLGGKVPTVISPHEYKSRFREAMDYYFVFVPHSHTGFKLRKPSSN